MLLQESGPAVGIAEFAEELAVIYFFHQTENTIYPAGSVGNHTGGIEVDE